MRDVTRSDVSLAVQTGGSVAAVEALERKPLLAATGVLVASLEEIHVLHCALLSAPHQFASERSFWFRMGFFREGAAELASALVKAVVTAS